MMQRQRFRLTVSLAAFLLMGSGVVAAPSGSDETARPNRLIDEASLYLRQHADNPVDWVSVGKGGFRESEAGEKADLSVGRLFDLSLVSRDGTGKLH
jgi:hypothetical protein